MKKIWPILALLLTLGVFSPAAHAAIKLTFGNVVELRRVDAEVKAITGPDGAPLHLAQQINTKFFGLPYSVHSEGLVFTDGRNFIADIPHGEELAMLQKGGLLPSPLPTVELTWSDYLLGYLLWIIIGGVFSFLVIVALIPKKYFIKDAPPTSPTNPTNPPSS